MLARRRHDHILEVLRTGGPTEVSALSRELGVSGATVRRDLSFLESEGMLQRVHGGAAPLGTSEPPYEIVAVDHHDAKQQVGDLAAGLVRDGDVLLVDIGTTTSHLARALRGRDVTVITSSLPVYEELADDESVELILLGGVVRRNYRSLVGFLTEQAIRQVHADVLFLSTSGVRRDGSVLDTTTVEVPVKRAMLEVAERTVLLADADKFPGKGIARVCGPGDLAAVVTEPGADAATLDCLREHGVEIITSLEAPA
ncbi:DeoR/GlpR family DNA-binding transcription regulator [Nocardioides mesophilus]|uniref:DeoR/GlpR transcriptional regulator n=1 Tax=Nocardioides mesophilus TaxID=433659 RepID=A0A7G9REZ9_9ACTN|nr:DeoR/GlpR family DNA-binding transcription regulator [Nocardioides mesophilus]QNN54174.1 DeoR/GlpR transcriptional regulator [Nocardioides mesophilus]